MRTDPTDNGGMFVGRRPGTAPVRHRTVPAQGSRARRRVDRAVAAFVLSCMVLLNLMFWGPMPAAGLWVAAQVQYRTENIAVALVVGFAVILTLLFGGLVILKRIDRTWILIRRAAGYDQRKGVLTPVFATTCVVGVVCFRSGCSASPGSGPRSPPRAEGCRASSTTGSSRR